MNRLCFVALFFLAGCSSIPSGFPAPASLPGEARQLPLRMALAPPEVELSADERTKDYLPVEVLDSRQFAQELVDWTRSAGVVTHVRALRSPSLEEQMNEAWEERDDLILQLRLGRFRTNFDGHNGWWIPNILNWAFWMVPAWFVATEEYSLAFEAELRVRSVDSDRVLHRAQVDVSVAGTFDEFDRGWQFFGFIYPNNDADNWRTIARALLPEARSQLGRALADELRGGFSNRMGRGDVQEKLRKTLALVVGVSHYQDQVRLPPLPYAADDARRLAHVLVNPTGTGLPARQVTTLVGGDATLLRLEQAVANLAARARPGDQTLFYFAGYGARAEDGEPVIILNQEGGSLQLPLSKLGELLATIPGQRLAILDCGFDGRGRSVAHSAQPPDSPQADALRLANAMQGAALISVQPGGTLLAPEHLASGLFTHHLTLGLEGPADQDQNGEITAAELLSHTGQRTVAEAAYDGSHQRPVLAGQASVGLPSRKDTPGEARE